MPHFFGFRQIYLRVAGKRTLLPGTAVLEGPYDTAMMATLARFNASKHWDGVCGPVFEAADTSEAAALVEANTPKTSQP